MNSLGIIGIVEIGLIAAIIIFQIYVFLDTWKNIRCFKSTFPVVEDFQIVKVRVPNEKLSSITAEQIFEDMEEFEMSDSSVKASVHKTDLMLVKTTGAQNSVLSTVLGAINTYLLRNKGAVSDFNLIKDVVERNSDAQDEEINTQLPIPLYLGLMGTMLGIIVGLLAMTDLGVLSQTGVEVVSSQPDLGVSSLIRGVSIAMSASFIGLMLTTISSGLFYKGAKAKVEKLKNDFYTLIQTEMLPVLSKDATSAIIALQRNLNTFNTDFAQNMGGFNTVLDRILDSFDGQVDMMAQLKEIDVAKIARLNVDVMKELRQSAKEFEKFNSYLGQVNEFVDSARQLNFNIANQLERTQSIENIACAIRDNISLNHSLIETYKADLAQIDARKQYINEAVVSMDDTLRKSLSQLEQMTAERIEKIRAIVIKEEDFIDNLISKDATNFDELKNLSKMRLSVEAMCVEDKTQTEHVKALMASQDAKIDRVVGEISTLLSTLDSRDKAKNRMNLSTQIALWVCAACVVVFLSYLLYQGQTASQNKSVADDKLIEYLETKEAIHNQQMQQIQNNVVPNQTRNVKK